MCGNITYSIADEKAILSVNSEGLVTPNDLGTTKVKITDETNKYSTYVIFEIIDGETSSQIKAGDTFTLALKENGKVWTFGDNGIIKTNEPTQIINEIGELKNIVDIGAGNKISIAVNEAGEVFTWGKCYEGNTEKIIKEPKKEESLTDVISVDANGENFYAVDRSGNAYIWGKGYNKPTKIESQIKYIDISGKLLLGENGLVYRLEKPEEKINYLSNIAEIGIGENHEVFLSLDGNVYTIGENTEGQLGNKQNITSEKPVLVKEENNYLSNAVRVSAGDKSSIATTLSGKAYVFGNNTNKKLGIEETNINYAKEIIKFQDKESKELTNLQIEKIETGKNHSIISDIRGFVYTVGLNTSGELGTEDNQNREIFTKIGNIEIMTEPKEINIPINTEQDIIIALGNTFNLKTDISEGADVNAYSTNEKELEAVKIPGVDNTGITNIKEIKQNYKLRGNKIGRVNLRAESTNGYAKNIWVNVVNAEDIEVSGKVVNGNGFTVALRSDGTIYGFGNINGKNNPEEIKAPEKIIDIAAGYKHVILLGQSGTVYTLGENGNGQLGTGNTTTYRTVTKININAITKVIAQGNTSFAIDKDGKTYGFGEGYGKTPALIKKDKNIIDISKKYYLTDEGKVYRLNDDEEIKLSYNNYEPWEDPIYIENDKIMQMSEGKDHLLLLGKSGNVYSYGQNMYGQLGDNETIPREEGITTVVKVRDESGALVYLENIVEVSAGEEYGVAVTNTGKVYTWGVNRYQTLGFSNELNAGGIEESGVAILKEDIQDTERVTAGVVHTSVYKEDGNVYTWGQGKEGNLGNAENFDYYKSQLVRKSYNSNKYSRTSIKKRRIL